MTQTDTKEEQGNQRSEIAFPYSALEDAERVALALFDWGGNEVALDQTAATLKTTVKSSGFRTDVAAARTFGLTEGRGVLTLTPLGRALVDSKRAPAARVQAFLSVPLFNAIYEAHQGQVLPGTKGIEAEMLRLGVGPKQTVRARQIFQRSAQHAGFFNQGPDRLVAPRTDGPSDERGKNGDDVSERSGTNDGTAGLSDEVSVLMQLLLSDGEKWPQDMVMSYLAAARKLYKKNP